MRSLSGIVAAISSAVRHNHDMIFKVRVASATIKQCSELEAVQELISTATEFKAVRLGVPGSVFGISVRRLPSYLHGMNIEQLHRLQLLKGGIYRTGPNNLAAVVFSDQRVQCRKLAKWIDGQYLPCERRVVAQIYVVFSSPAERHSIISCLDKFPSPGTVHLALKSEAIILSADLKRVGFVGFLFPLRTMEALRQELGRFFHSGLLTELQHTIGTGCSNYFPGCCEVLYSDHNLNLLESTIKKHMWRLPAVSEAPNCLFPLFQIDF